MNVQIGAMLNGTSWEQWDTDAVLSQTVFQPSDDDLTDMFSLLDAKVTAAKQCFSDLITPAATVHTGTGTATTTITRTENSNHVYVITILTVTPHLTAKLTDNGVVVDAWTGAELEGYFGIAIPVRANDWGGTVPVCYTYVTLNNDGTWVVGDTFTFNGSTGLIDGVVLGIDAWVEKRYQERHADFAHNCRTARLVFHVGTEVVNDGSAEAVVRVGRFAMRGFEVEVIPAESKRMDD